MQVRYKQTQEKGRAFLGIIVGSAGFINLPVMGKFRPLFHLFSDTFLKPTQHSKQCIRQHSFCATRVSRVGTHLITARNPHSHKAMTWELCTTSAGGLYGLRRARELETCLPQICPQIPRFFLWSPLTHPDMGMGTMHVPGCCSFRHKIIPLLMPGTGTCS